MAPKRKEQMKRNQLFTNPILLIPFLMAASATGSEGTFRLNKVDDLSESNNLYLKHPGVVQRLKTTLEKIKANENYKPTKLEQPEEELTIEQLNELFAASTSTDQSR